MRIDGMTLNIVRNEYEFNKYISDTYRKQHTFESVKDSLPLVVVQVVKKAAPENYVTGCKLSFTPAVDFTSISGTGYKVDSVNKNRLDVDFTSINELVFKAEAELKLTTPIVELDCKLVDKLAFIYEASAKGLDLTDNMGLLGLINDKVCQQGEDFIGVLAYEQFAQQPAILVVKALPENPKDNVLYIVPNNAEERV